MTTLATTPTIAGDVGTPAAEPKSKNHQVLPLAAALLVTAAVWVVLFVVRLHAHQANVDDYAYAAAARGLLRSADPISAFLHTGATSPLVPALAAPGVGLGGVYGAMTVELPFLLLLVLGVYLLARQWISPMAAMVAALAVALNEDVSSYAVMLHFAVPTTAALVWAVHSYLRSRHFQDWTWSLIFGVAIAAMLLSRSMSLVYVLPLVVVVGVGLVIDIAKNGNVLRLPALGAVLAVFVLAGPWWLVSGHTAIDYLQNAGYDPSSGFTTQGASLDPAAVMRRVRWTLVELGWGESWALGIALLAALGGFVRYRLTLRLTGLWILALWVVLTTLILSSSSNQGTGFGMPVIVILIVLAAAVLGQMPWRILPALGVVLAGVLVVGLVAETTGLGWWWPAAPYRGEVLGAGGTSRTNADLISAQVARLVGSSPTLVAQESDILNANGIKWNGDSKRQALILPPQAPNATPTAIGDLARVRMAITGSTSFSYHPTVNQGAVETAALHDGFHVVRVWQRSRGFSILVWQRGKGLATATVAPPATQVVQPSSGTEVKGNTYLAAAASERTFAVTGLEFVVRGAGQTKTIRAWQVGYGWLGAFGSEGLPDGSYTVQSVATAADGGVGKSRPVLFRIAN